MREDVEAWEKRTGIKVEPGDAMFLRTGRWAREAKMGPPGVPVPSGYDLSFLPFLKERDVAVIGSDWTHDVGTVVGVQYPVHRFAIVALGMTLLDNVDLEQLAETAASLNRWDFLLAVAPTNAVNGTGAPVNPLAIF
jgi:kynurenine formamidase